MIDPCDPRRARVSSRIFGKGSSVIGRFSVLTRQPAHHLLRCRSYALSLRALNEQRPFAFARGERESPTWSMLAFAVEDAEPEAHGPFGEDLEVRK
jgi:hypothetical protein